MPITAARTVSRIRTRSTVKNPGETMPGAERRPMGPPISSVKFLSRGSLRLGIDQSDTSAVLRRLCLLHVPELTGAAAGAALRRANG